jgi:hypothetical protein
LGVIFGAIRRLTEGDEAWLEQANDLLMCRFPALKHVQVSGKVSLEHSLVTKAVRMVFGLPDLEVEEDVTA